MSEIALMLQDALCGEPTTLTIGKDRSGYYAQWQDRRYPIEPDGYVDGDGKHHPGAFDTDSYFLNGEYIGPKKYKYPWFKAKPGRPRSVEGRAKSRQIGRVSDEDWDRISEAAQKVHERDGRSKTQWLLDVIKLAAEEVLQK